MKKSQMLFCLFLSLLFVQCSKDGDTGPAGKDGNANIEIYEFGAKTFTGQASYSIPNFSQQRLDSSMVIAYYIPSNELSSGVWYQVGSISSINLFDTRGFYNITSNSLNYGVRTLNHDGGSFGTPVTFSKFRIYVMKANSIQHIAAAKLNNIKDIKEFEEVIGL